jgi:hypothetical protein
MTELSLKSVWNIRLKLNAKSDILRAESNRFGRVGIEENILIFRVKRDLFKAKSSKIWAKSDILRAEANELWAEAILETFGNIKIEWKNFNDEKNDHECHLENGEIYGFD